MQAVQYEKEMSKINAMAEMLITTTMTAAQRSRMEDEIMRGLMRIKGIAQFDGSFTTSESLDNCHDASKYSSVILTQAYQYALKHIGDIDPDTQKKYEFCKLFNKAYKIKAQGLAEEKLKETKGFDQAVKKAMVKDLLRTEGKLAGIVVGGLKFNVLNKNKVEDYMKSTGYNSDSFAKVMSIIDGTAVTSDTITGDDPSDEAGLAISDQHAYAEYTNGVEAVDNYCTALYRAFSNAKGEIEKTFLKYWITFNCYDNPSGFKAIGIYLEGLVDKVFLSFLEANNGFDKLADALVVYSGYKRETVLKNIAKAQKLIALKPSPLKPMEVNL